MAVQYSEVEAGRVLTVIDADGDVTGRLPIGVRSAPVTNTVNGSIAAGANRRENESIRIRVMPVTQGADGARPNLNVIVSGAWAPTDPEAFRTRLLRNDAATTDASFTVMFYPTSDHSDAEAWPVDWTDAGDVGNQSITFDPIDSSRLGSGYIAVQMTSASLGGFSYAVAIESIPATQTPKAI